MKSQKQLRAEVTQFPPQVCIKKYSKNQDTMGT